MSAFIFYAFFVFGIETTGRLANGIEVAPVAEAVEGRPV
jgi:hypothetical protein